MISSSTPTTASSENSSTQPPVQNKGKDLYDVASSLIDMAQTEEDSSQRTSPVTEVDTSASVKVVKRTAMAEYNDRNEAGFAKSFPEKLHDILESDIAKNSLVWHPDGKSFIVINEKTLAKEVLPYFFKVSQYKSFVRRLYRWGFRLKPKVKIQTFYHKLFQRGNCDKCTRMKCKYSQKQLSRQAPKDARLDISGLSFDTPLRIPTRINNKRNPDEITSHGTELLSVDNHLSLENQMSMPQGMQGIHATLGPNQQLIYQPIEAGPNPIATQVVAPGTATANLTPLQIQSMCNSQKQYQDRLIHKLLISQAANAFTGPTIPVPVALIQPQYQIVAAPQVALADPNFFVQQQQMQPQNFLGGCTDLVQTLPTAQHIQHQGQPAIILYPNIQNFPN